MKPSLLHGARAESGSLAADVNHAVNSSYILSFVESVPEVSANYHRGHWHLLTISFNGQQPFATNADAHACLNYWDGGNTAIQNLVSQQLIRGACWVEEFKALQFLPLLVMPHVHALVEADEVGTAALDAVTQALTRYRNEQHEPLALTPNLHVKRLNSQKALFDTIQYLFKPLDLLEAYQSAWPRVAAHGRSEAWQLNSQTRDLSLGVQEITKKRMQLRTKGNLNANHREYIGVPRAERGRHRRLLNEVRETVEA